MRHVPVLLSELLDSLQLKSGMNVIDCTLGDGGHAEAMLEQTAPHGQLLGIDADPESLVRAKMYLYRFANRVRYVRDNFVQLEKIVVEERLGPVQAIVMDFGWSRPQFEERGRGFSFQHPEEPLDMRYTAQSAGGMTAADVLNQWPEEQLETVFREYGEEELSRELAKAIVTKRKEASLATVNDLVQLVLRVYRQKLRTTKEIPWVGGLHPATKVFQALRIAVNQELEYIERTLPQAIDILVAGGRLAVITFHSLEDRLVKHYFKSENEKKIRIITKKPIIAGQKEQAENSSSRSAKLRVVEKI